MICHISAYLVIFSIVDEWRLIWFAPITIAEVPIIVSVLAMVNRSGSGKRRSAGRGR
jgi:hypothetical protein